MILANMQDGDTSGLEFLGESEIGDIDGDGMREVLDGWGNPIAFLRWAPGYLSNWPVDPSTCDSVYSPSMYPNTGFDGDGDGCPDQKGVVSMQTAMRLDPINLATPIASPDPFDPLRVDPTWSDGNPLNDHYALFPLIFSPGRDEESSIVVQPPTPFPAAQNNPYFDLTTLDPTLFKFLGYPDRRAVGGRHHQPLHRGAVMRIKQPRRGGMTLVELLVVVAMASVLLAITVSSLRGSFSDRKLRETSRIVTAFMARAKARAAETGRPTGVVFVREVAPDPADPASFNFCRKLFIAETPPPYAGDIAGATCTVSNPAVVVAGTPPGMVLAADIPTVAFGFGPFVLPDPVGLLEGPSAYQIKLDYRGEQFPIVKVAGVPIVQVLGATSRVFFFVPAQSNSIWQNMIVARRWRRA